MSKKPDKAILFLYEGDTELGFYDTLFDKLELTRVAQIKKKCLKGNWKIDSKVADKIDQFLENEKNNHVQYLTVVVAYDREDTRDVRGKLNKREIIKRIADKRLRDIHEIIATQELESWFFIDIQGIYNYLKMPPSRQKPAKYKNTEVYDATHLNELFKEADSKKRYIKGDTAKTFIDKLDLIKIYRECPDLKSGIDLIFQTAGLKLPKV